MKLCLLYISVATTFLAICISSAQDNEQTVSELTDGITEFQGLHTSQLVVLLLFQRNFASVFEENNDPLEDCLADFTRENPAEAAKLNREITSIFEVHSIIQKYWGKIILQTISLTGVCKMHRHF
ncbi:unnamed protein product [Heterobilharzia americana]|nr:unnamed protein product [Heterobilharzia americana]